MKDLFTLTYLHAALTSKYVAYFFVGICVLFVIDLQSYATGAATIVLTLFGIVLTLFVPYMLIVLFFYQKTGWLIGFAVCIGISFIPTTFFSPEIEYISYLYDMLPIIFLLFYMWALRQKVGEWLIESEAFAQR